TEIAARGGKLEPGKGCRERRKGTPAPLPGFFSDVRKVGYLRKPKSMHKRFFVLRAASESGPARLEYYENEKKWRHKSGAPKRSIPLESCFNINKRADSKNKHLVALYTKDEHFAIAADSEPEQESWYQALLQLHNRAKAGEDSYGEVAPGPAFKEVWQVILKPKGLGQTKNLIGIYRLCLTNKTISFVKLNSDAAAVVLQLLNIRRCGHSENFFFIEVGRSAVTGPGEFWMQVDDSVVAQNMHETILEAMRTSTTSAWEGRPPLPAAAWQLPMAISSHAPAILSSSPVILVHPAVLEVVVRMLLTWRRHSESGLTLQALRPPSPTRRHPHSLRWLLLRSTRRCCLLTPVAAAGCPPTATQPLCPLTPTQRSAWRCTTWTVAIIGPTPPRTRMMATCPCHLVSPLCPAVGGPLRVVTICP
uniref:Insulin receptor substrate 1 n=1 Tax=Ficedula albicollis TaxID=59894 RepID=A0A803VG43_FICAL